MLVLPIEDGVLSGVEIVYLWILRYVFLSFLLYISLLILKIVVHFTDSVRACGPFSWMRMSLMGGDCSVLWPMLRWTE